MDKKKEKQRFKSLNERASYFDFYFDFDDMLKKMKMQGATKYIILKNDKVVKRGPIHELAKQEFWLDKEDWIAEFVKQNQTAVIAFWPVDKKDYDKDSIGVKY